MVEEIIAKKERTNAREKFFQQLVWGNVHTDGHGNAIPREAPAYWESLKSAVVSGGGVEYTRSLNKPDVLTVGGRRAGKATKIEAQIEGTRAAISWLDEHIALLVAGWQDPYQGVRDLVRKSGTTPAPSVIPEVASVRWSCKRPTAPVYAVGSNGWLMEQAAARISPLEREYNRKLNAASRAKARELMLMMGVEAFDADD